MGKQLGVVRMAISNNWEYSVKHSSFGNARGLILYEDIGDRERKMKMKEAVGLQKGVYILVYGSEYGAW